VVLARVQILALTAGGAVPGGNERAVDQDGFALGDWRDVDSGQFARQPSLRSLASDVRDAAKDRLARNMRVFAVGVDASGKPYVGSSNGFDPGQKEMADRLNITRVPSSRGNHAEENLLKADVGIMKVGTWHRMPCGPMEHDCLKQLISRGVEVEQ
jgi:hypothetical protein